MHVAETGLKDEHFKETIIIILMGRIIKTTSPFCLLSFYFI